MSKAIGLQFITILLLLTVVLSLADPILNPPPAEAQLGTIVRWAGCVGGSIAGGWLAQKITDWVGKWIGSKIAGLIGVVAATEVPVEDNNVIDNTGAIRYKEFVLDIVVRCTAREILKAMNDDILNTVRTSGREGGPAWVRNWRNYQTDAQYRGENVFRAILSTTNLCPHIAQDVRSLFNASQGVQLPGQNTRVNDLDPFQLRSSCTLPPGFNLDQFKQNVGANGGWEAFLRLHQPQNNYYGQVLASLDEVARQRSLEQSGDTSEAVGAMGFTGRRGSDPQSSCLVRGLNGQCIAFKDILTPGSVLEGSVMNTIEKELEWVANSDELSELIATGIELLLNRLLDLGDPDEGDLLEPNDLNNVPTGSIFPPPIEPTPGGGGGGTGGQCADTGTGTADHEGALDAAIDAVLTDPTIANLPNTRDNAFVFMNAVVAQLQTQGYQATTQVLNGNDNSNNNGDRMAVWQLGDTTVERYDVVVNVNCINEGNCQSTNDTIGEAAWSDYTGDIPLACLI